MKGYADLMPKTLGSLARKKNIQFRTADDVKRRADLLSKTPGKEWNRIFGQKMTVTSARFKRNAART